MRYLWRMSQGVDGQVCGRVAGWFAVLAAIVAATPVPSGTPAPPAPVAAPRITLEDLHSDIRRPDVAISPSGRYLAGVVVGKDSSAVTVTDLATGETRNIVGVGKDAMAKQTEAVISEVFWKSDGRLLFRMGIYPRDGARFRLRLDNIGRVGSRLLAVDRDGRNMVSLLADTTHRAMSGALDLGSIASFLPHQPDHVMMTVDGLRGRSLFRVDVRTGQGELVDPPSPAVIGWWLDVEGAPIVRIEASSGTIRLRRKDAEGRWKVFYKVRWRELEDRPDYVPVGPSDVAGEYYVLARPEGRERTGLYRYDLTRESFGEPVVEHPRYDLVSAVISRDGKRVLRYCYIEHVRICRFADPRIEEHMTSVRRYFDDSANVSIYDAAEDESVLLLRVDGPHHPPSFHSYRVDRRRLDSIGPMREPLQGKAMPRASVVEWKARDGLALTGYLTRPPGAPASEPLPLILHPHGGPEARDWLTFDPWVQYFTARGYAVFQPDFRGSDGYGRSFVALGHGQWGRAMQDDLTDGVRHLIDRGIADPRRVCIVGASYGGYAALAGAALTPDLYRCAVSVAGVSDLAEFIAWRKWKWGADSEGYTYWLTSIGDPKRDAEKLAAVSPARLAAAIKAPVLLIHGDQDGIVPIAQSLAMQKALGKVGRKTELMTLVDEGHWGWSIDNERRVLIGIDRFLWEHLGPGVGVTEAPPTLPPAAE